MKISTRLSLLFVLCSTASLLLCGLLLLHASETNTIRSLQSNGTAELNMLQTSFTAVAAKSIDVNLSDTARQSLLVYLFRGYAEDSLSTSQYILKQGEDTLYNNSGYAPKALLLGRETNTAFSQGRNLLAVGTQIELLKETYQIYLIRDVTDVYEGITKLRLQFILICLVSLGINAGLILLSTRRALRPLHTLRQAAAAMAAGDYGSRVPLSQGAMRRGDEITALSLSFNHMAAAVEEHVSTVNRLAEERKMLLGALTHELKTPMTAIVGYAQSLERAKLSPQQQQDALSFLHRETRRLDRLSQKMMQLLTLTEGEAPQLAPLSARALFEEARGTLLPIAKGYGAVLSFTEQGEVFAADADLLIDVLVNLVDNAGSAGAKHIAIAARGQVLFVSDDGSGMSEQVLSRVTEPFFRADKSRSRKGGHVGLGLSLVNRIAQLHKAGVQIDSAPGQGTTVSLIFEENLQNPYIPPKTC